MNKTKTHAYDFTASGDYAFDAFSNFLDEIDALLLAVNALYKLSAGTSKPAGFQENDVWIDTTGGTPVLKIVDSGGNSLNLGATGYFDNPGGTGAGVDLDDAFSGYLRNVKITRHATPGWANSRIQVVASSDSPATVVLPNGKVLQNTSAVEVDFAAAPAGEYQIYAEHGGSAVTTFVIGKADIAATLTAGTQIKIGEVTWSTADDPATADFRYIASREDTPEMGRVPRGITHLAVMATHALTDNVATRIEFDTAVIDQDQAYDSDLKTFICPRTGLWRITSGLRAKFSDNSSPTISTLSVEKYGSPNTVLANQRIKTEVADGQSSTPNRVEAILSLTFGDRIDVMATVNVSAPPVTVPPTPDTTIDAYYTGWNNYSTYFTAEYLGPAA